MAYRITFVLDLFKGPQEQALSHQVLQFLLDALYQTNVAYLQANPNTPRIYSAGVVERNPGAVPETIALKEQPGANPRMHYQEEPLGQEDWKDIPTCLTDGIADCEDLACWRAAEVTVFDNIPAKPTFTWKVRPNGAYLYHIVVKYPDGQIEDPSKKLGMGRS